VVTTGAISLAMLQSNCHHRQAKPDALPVAQPAVSKHGREKDTSEKYTCKAKTVSTVSLCADEWHSSVCADVPRCSVY